MEVAFALFVLKTTGHWLTPMPGEVFLGDQMGDFMLPRLGRPMGG
jgi:hypothetical protein